MSKIQESTIKFLARLADNNNREWFHANKEEYKAALENFKAFAENLVDAMNEVDQLEAHKVFRIYRDVRFSKDKTPYNPDFRLSMTRAGKHRRGGYYLRVSPEASFVAAGFWNPNSPDLSLIRHHIVDDMENYEKVLSEENFIKHFGSLYGDEVKTAPKGFKKDNPAIVHIRKKQFLVKKEFGPKAVIRDDFISELVTSYQAVRPYFDLMSDYLTHDLNGSPI